MHLFRYAHPDGPRLGLQDGDVRFDLFGDPRFVSLASWLALPDPLDAVQSATRGAQLPDDVELLAPCDEQEVWASGVTYLRSKIARMEESEEGGDFYDKVYEAERPELFAKCAGWRAVGPGGAIRVRADSSWDVPEPEWTLVLSSRGQIVGSTCGNDVSSRSIEGENPLYLPQAKCYDGSCALGPMILLHDEIAGPFDIRLSIARDRQTVFEGATSTAQMRRNAPELASYLFREMSFPHGALLLTGTGIVPPDGFTLQSGDAVTVEIEVIGTLENAVA